MTTCPACRWENDADSGTCTGCGRALTGAAGVAAAGPAGPPVAQALPPPEPGYAAEPEPPVVHRVAEPVMIHPQHRPVPRTVEPSRDGPRTVDVARAPRPVDTGYRAPAAVRDIPVVVAPSATRAAVRFRDNEVSPDPGPPLAAPGRLPVGSGTRMCPSCGTVVETTRRFCRCGARLPAAEGARARGGTATREEWTAAAFRRAQRAANGGRRVGYDASLAVRAYLVRALLVLLLMLVVGSQAPPWGADVRNWVQTRVEQVLPGH